MMEEAKGRLSAWRAAWLAVLLFIVGCPVTAWAQFPLEINGLFRFTGGAALLENSRSGEFFTDCNKQTISTCQGTGGTLNNDSVGWYVGGGLDLPVWGLPWGHMIAFEIEIEFARFSSGKSFFQIIENGPVTGGPTPCGAGRCPVGTKPGFGEGQRSDAIPGTRKVVVSTFQVAFSPKYRFDTFVKSRKIRPWIIPAGFEMSVNSPPPAQFNLWDIGGVSGVGVDIHLWERVWVGLESRYHFRSGQTGVDTNHVTAGGFVGLAF